MLTLKQIYDDKEAIIAGLEKKHFNNAREVIEGVIAIDAARKAAQQKKDNASAELNQISKSIGMLILKFNSANICFQHIINICNYLFN